MPARQVDCHSVVCCRPPSAPPHNPSSGTPLAPNAIPLDPLAQGVARLIAHLSMHSIPLALATSTPRATLERKLSSKDAMRAAFQPHLCVCGDDVQVQTSGAACLHCNVLACSVAGPLVRRATGHNQHWEPDHRAPLQNGKPAPDCFTAVAKRLGLPPSACLVIEDAPAGVAAATAAGMRVVAVPSILQKGGRPSALYPKPDSAAPAGCVSILPSLLEFRPEQYGLPPFEGGWQRWRVGLLWCGGRRLVRLGLCPSQAHQQSAGIHQSAGLHPPLRTMPRQTASGRPCPCIRCCTCGALWCPALDAAAASWVSACSAGWTRRQVTLFASVVPQASPHLLSCAACWGGCHHASSSPFAAVCCRHPHGKPGCRLAAGHPGRSSHR